MDLRHLRYIAAARNGSCRAAANEFNVRHLIVSKRIKEIEDELGVRLFERFTAGARLTPLGEDLRCGRTIHLRTNRSSIGRI